MIDFLRRKIVLLLDALRQKYASSLLKLKCLSLETSCDRLIRIPAQGVQITGGVVWYRLIIMNLKCISW